MLSYQHIFHAGNHADILKHLTLTLILDYMIKKDKPLTFFDTHAGAGIYSLNDERALKTKEADNGIRRLIDFIEGRIKPDTEQDSVIREKLEIIKPYTDIVIPYYRQNLYPGSPMIAASILRKCDRMILSELHPQVINELRQNIRLAQKNKICPDISVHFRNGIEMLNALTPPEIKRGAVIIDPSYEDKDEYENTGKLVCRIHKKWQAGIIILWYPLIEHRISEINAMKDMIAESVSGSSAEPDFLITELKVKEPESLSGLASLYGSGMLVVNPPFGLEEKMTEIIPLLEGCLKEGGLSA